MIAIDKTPLETDVLVVGGGIAGLMAAISAAEQGVEVVVAEPDIALTKSFAPTVNADAGDQVTITVTASRPASAWIVLLSS